MGKKNLIFTLILECRVPKSLEKPLKLQNYDGTRDLDEHVKHVDDHLAYYHVDKVVKCKLFALTLSESFMSLCNSIPNGSIDSWIDLSEVFTAYLTAKKRKLTIMVLLIKITQGKKETMHEYNNDFTKMVVVVGGSDKSQKCWKFEKGMRLDCAFREY